MKALLASLFLVVGVALAAATAETGQVWWAIAGYICLLFVPALIIDAANDRR